MITSTISTARMLITPTGGAADSAVGSVMPTPDSSRCMYPLQPIATVIAPTAYSRIKSQPIIHATSSPSVAYA